MSEYTLTKDITTYKYPSHMKRPEGFFGSNFFEKWIPNWQTHLGHLSNKSNVIGIEIGVLNGDCTVFCADQIVNGNNSLHYAVDINESEYLKNNIAPYKNIKFIQGESHEILRNLTHSGMTKEFADYIYIDGDHRSKMVMEDAVWSWPLLKFGGILCFDDFGWGKHVENHPDRDILIPQSSIEAFLKIYRNHYTLLQMGWQVFIKKEKYSYPKEEDEANYKK